MCETRTQEIREKTLEAWVLLPDLLQHGDLISIEYAFTFDAIVFGEFESKKWAAGSEWFRRTVNLAAPVENAKPTDPIHMAIVYDLDGGITVYRDGKRYGERYVPRGSDHATLRTYPAGESRVLLGQRLTGADNGFLTGAIEEARLYDRALTADEVAASFRAGIIQHTTENGVSKAPGTGTVAVRSAESKPPVPPPAEPMKTNALALRGKTAAARRRGGGTDKADIAAPFRVATNGLADRRFIDPLSSWPDPFGYYRPDTWERWANPKDFAWLTTKGALVYQPLPESRFVCEIELTHHRTGAIDLAFGDLFNSPAIVLGWNSKRGVVECYTAHGHGVFGLGGSWDFPPDQRIRLKIVVGDGRFMVFHDDKRIEVGCWPVNCWLKICSKVAASGVIHSCLLRPLTPEDVAACGWPTPPKTVPFKDGEAAARLSNISKGYPSKPKIGERFAVQTTGTPMAWIAAGEFELGTRDPKDPASKTRHRVKLTSGYWMAQTEVTQKEFRNVMGANPSRITGSPFLPVDWVSWDQAMAYCQRITQQERKAKRIRPGYEYRLPTEAEREYGARAGSDDDFSVPEKQVWSWETSGGRPHEVAETQPNNWGLYDMHGNAMEWCFDAWQDFPKDVQGAAVNPFQTGNPEKDTFVVRGGAWWIDPRKCTSHWRERNHSNANGFRGFRIVLGPAINSFEQ